MRITCIGGGPAGLYFALLVKKANPAHAVTVLERNAAGEGYGWGVVFSDATLANFAAADRESFERIQAGFHHWDDIDIFFRGEKFSSRGHGFCGIGRRELLAILGARAEALGVTLRFGVEVDDPEACADSDLIVAADGVRSPTRERYAAAFAPETDLGRCRYIWLGTRKRLEAFTFAFEQTPWGWFTLHAYRFDADTSAFIVEAREETWEAAGLASADLAASVAFCEQRFAAHLDGQPLLADFGGRRGAAWLKFQRVLCRRWHHRNIVLMGDAAHAAHFSIGSGAKLAMEDAISLAAALTAETDLERALESYQAEREPEALKLQSAARNRMEWFENVERHARLPPLQFSYALLTGSQRIGHANLQQRDPDYVAGVERWLAQASGLAAEPLPPMFTPYRLRELELPNRVVVSPMATYSCSEGLPDDFLLVHLGARALGGAGLVMSEMVGVSPGARITPGCAGLWNAAQEQAWARIAAFVHGHSGARLGLQLGHAGPKGSTQLGWQAMDEPLAAGNWPLIAASPLAYGPRNPLPRAMDRTDMDAVVADFVAAARRGAAAGFDLLELHCAHGYLLSSFICPLTNRREDGYGGDLAGRMRFPLEVFTALRAAWPARLPMSVRISAHDWAPGGNTPEDAVAMARLFRAAGADLIDVSSGQTTREARPVYGRMYQTPFAELIRNEVGIATIAVGNIFEADHINSIIAAGRADLCALGRPHLADPAWTLRAGALQAYAHTRWPKPYLAAKAQLESRLARSRDG